MIDEVKRPSENARRFSSDAKVEWLSESLTHTVVNELVGLVEMPLCGLRDLVTDAGGQP